MEVKIWICKSGYLLTQIWKCKIHLRNNNGVNKIETWGKNKTITNIFNPIIFTISIIIIFIVIITIIFIIFLSSVPLFWQKLSISSFTQSLLLSPQSTSLPLPQSINLYLNQHFPLYHHHYIRQDYQKLTSSLLSKSKSLLQSSALYLKHYSRFSRQLHPYH